MQLLHDPAIALLGIHPTGMKTCSHTKICKQVFTVDLFMIAPNWKQPRNLSMNEGLNKLVPVYHGILLSKKKTRLLIYI